MKQLGGKEDARDSACGLRLRPFQPADADDLFQAISESEAQLCRWFHWCHPGYSREEAAAFTRSRPAARASRREFDFGVEETDTGRLVGAIGVSRIDRANALANIGYWIRTSAAGRGYATLALGLATRFGFEELGLARLEVLCAAGNEASIRVAEKAGFQREGTLRHRFVLNGRPHDAVLLSMLSRAWMASVASPPVAIPPSALLPSERRRRRRR